MVTEKFPSTSLVFYAENKNKQGVIAPRCTGRASSSTPNGSTEAATERVSSDEISEMRTMIWSLLNWLC
ncbi:hypothetical protein TELCIR_19302 [Teladorsagia circumcincta]|uniref:Uncharacterized protein n=1 Tax=Teladorsagia circumcincta TaxID=45464 RepID=A0A2G9TMQ6_TELCI|nr:hypothetical protein TELCIR_19302 [Teladorsagia circumcincta]